MNARLHRTGVALALGAGVALLCGTAATAQQIINVDPPGMIQNETSLAIVPGPVPGQPAFLVVAYNNDPLGMTGLGVAISTDAGATWTNYAVPNPLDPGGSGLQMTEAFDPAADFDPSGQLYVAQISTLFGWPGASGLFVRRYDPFSGSWNPPVPVSYSPPAGANPDPFYRFNDKCHLRVDRDVAGVSPFAGNVYAAWIQDGGYNVGASSDIFFAVSSDQGATWKYPGGSTVPVPINDNPYVPLGPPSDLANGPNVAVAPDGAVYVAWLDIDVTQPQALGTLRIDRSPDAGITWGQDVNVRTNVVGCPGHLSTMLRMDARARSFPSLAVSPRLNTNGQYDVYLVYAEDPDGFAGPDESDVFLTRSTDGGATWSVPARVNTDATPTDQFEPWIRVKPNGSLDVAWYDRRYDGTDTMWDVCITRSDDGGKSFGTEVMLTDATTRFATPNMTWGERWMGEYLGLAVDDRFAYVAFTTSIRDTLGDVCFAMVENAAMPTAVPETGATPGRAGPEIRAANPYREGEPVLLSLPVAGAVRLEVLDVAGRHVRTLVSDPLPAGDHRATWDGRDARGRDAAAGVYLLRLEAASTVAVRKVTLLR